LEVVTDASDQQSWLICHESEWSTLSIRTLELDIWNALEYM